MKNALLHRYAWAGLSLLLLSSCMPAAEAPTPAAPEADVAADLEAIKAQAQRLSEAYMAGDIEALVAIYTPDGVAAPGGRDFIRGTDDLLRLWQLPEGRTILRHQTTATEIVIDGDHAYDWGYYEGQAAQNDEPFDPFRGTYVIAWQRGDDGVWRIAVDMWSQLRN